jgi:hypothetical protein
MKKARSGAPQLAVPGDRVTRALAELAVSPP